MDRGVVLAAFVTLLATPVVDADLAQGGKGAAAPYAPQLYCELVQTEPHTSAAAQRCEATGAVTGAKVLRARIAGAGHVFAWIEDNIQHVQLVSLDCTVAATDGARSCTAPLPGTGGASSSSMTLRVLADGPGRAVYSVSVESMTSGTPSVP